MSAAFLPSKRRLASRARRAPQNAISATGSFKNFNTIEEFKNADKTALFNATADEIWKSIVVDRSTRLLTRFLLITFADLKKYKYFYWFAFPAFVTKPAWEIDREWTGAEGVLGKDAVRLSSLSSRGPTVLTRRPHAARGDPRAAARESQTVFPRPLRRSPD